MNQFVVVNKKISKTYNHMIWVVMMMIDDSDAVLQSAFATCQGRRRVVSCRRVIFTTIY